MTGYQEFIRTKNFRITSTGIDANLNDVNDILYPFQRDVTAWAVRKGRAALFLDTGLGKTFCQLEWARILGEKTLIIAPLSVSRQTTREGKKIEIDVQYVRSQEDVDDGDIFITNYEMVSNFDPSQFGAVILDESSILKSFAGKTQKLLSEMFQQTKYRLCCTATPAPNDHIELGQHAHFLGICTEAEMKAMFFINANKDHLVESGGIAYRKKGTNKAGTEWRLRHHGEEPFYKWLSGWAMCVVKPSDIGEYDDSLYDLLPLNIIPKVVKTDMPTPGELFFSGLHGISDRIVVRKNTIAERLSLLSEIITPEDQWIIWCGLNEESTAVNRATEGSVEIKGEHDPEYKAQVFKDFQDGKIRILVTKPKIGGFGMNFQNAHNMVFFGINDSWETWYQAIRRQWRYGQEYPVNVHVVYSDMEQGIYNNIRRKEALSNKLRRGLIDHIQNYEKQEIAMTDNQGIDIDEHTEQGDSWIAMMGDSCERLKEIKSDSVDLSVYSPPFADLFTYTDSLNDLGNCRNWDEFFDHYKFIIADVLRVTKPGRLTCVHTSDIPAMASRDGWIGVKDFPGTVIRAYEKEGWVFVGRAFVQKNPQAQAIRTKSKALLFVQIRKDSTDSRPALVDQILLFKKSGENQIPVNPVANNELDNERWIEWANGIWIGISESDTLQYQHARDKDDEKHICPLQLETIRRCIVLYSNPGETVLTPFGGIGSEAYVALKNDRKAILIELKRSYYEVALNNLKSVVSDQVEMFSG